MSFLNTIGSISLKSKSRHEEVPDNSKTCPFLENGLKNSSVHSFRKAGTEHRQLCGVVRAQAATLASLCFPDQKATPVLADGKPEGVQGSRLETQGQQAWS